MYGIVLEVCVILWRTSFWHYLQHYSRILRTTEIWLCLYGFIGKSVVIKYHQYFGPEALEPIVSMKKVTLWGSRNNELSWSIFNLITENRCKMVIFSRNMSQMVQCVIADTWSFLICFVSPSLMQQVAKYATILCHPLSAFVPICYLCWQ